MTKKIILCSAFCFLLSALCFASIPGQINYQGVLKDSAGNPLTGTYTMTFALYDTASGGSAIWSETQSVSVEAGLYNIQLGSNTALSSSVFDGSTKYLGVKVGADAEMTPRVVMVTVPYAFRAGTADTISGGTGSYVIFGTTEAQTTNEKYGIRITTDYDGAGAGYGIRSYVTGESNPRIAVSAVAPGTNSWGVYGDSSAGIAVQGNTSIGTAVYGSATSTTGTNYGLSGISNSTQGYGVYGEANSFSGTNYGVYGKSLSSNGYGVYGDANGGYIGVYGFSNSNSGVGVYGKGSPDGIAVTVDDLLYLKPRSGPPGGPPTPGLMFFNSDDGKLWIHGATTWEIVTSYEP